MGSPLAIATRAFSFGVTRQGTGLKARFEPRVDERSSLVHLETDTLSEVFGCLKRPAVAVKARAEGGGGDYGREPRWLLKGSEGSIRRIRGVRLASARAL
ncbi:hypothetical protein SAMN05216466_106315 [Paraburkholderia phenazinium]|uniref:Uncharacterized protein n=1 Tax=Paraburkholderia phenazinium TaxID=60549 RepID=A0A1G7YU49_9BURK|nr:hypothetical protein SAMN05216466_106315 [Paraburkholderia phenazinium]